MKLKMDADGHVVVQDGKPVYIHDDGKEVAFDAPQTLSTISRLNGEAKGHRERAEKAEGSLKAFEGITDPAGALKALETVKNLDSGQLLTAGKVEEMKAGIVKAAEDKFAAEKKSLSEKISDLTDKLGASESAYFAEKVGGAFARSKFITDKIAVPPDMVQAMFGTRFKIENGKIVGVGLDGQPIYSRSKAGEIADFDEAIESMVDAYPHRDSILKGTGGGSGAKGANSGNGGAKSMSRKEFDGLDPAARSAKLKEGFAITD